MSRSLTKRIDEAQDPEKAKLRATTVQVMEAFKNQKLPATLEETGEMLLTLPQGGRARLKLMGFE